MNTRYKYAGLGQAIALASKLFENITDKSGEPYILHCLEVRRNVMKWNDLELEIGAVLHDVVEDTHYTLQMLLDEEYSPRVVDIVDGLTKREGESYEDFILRIIKNQDHIKCKMGDIEHNSLIPRLKGVRQKDLDRITKYNKAWYLLDSYLIKSSKNLGVSDKTIEELLDNKKIELDDLYKKHLELVISNECCEEINYTIKKTIGNIEAFENLLQLKGNIQ